MSELKPCPFCGSEAETLIAESMYGGYLFGIMCNDCLSRGDVYDTEAEAIAAWNRRAERTCKQEESELNPDGLPVGLTISEDGELLNWRGENYVKQSTFGSGTLTGRSEGGGRMSGNIGKRTDAEIANYMAVKDGRKSRYSELFGTPERAAGTLLDACDNCGQNECSGCQVYELTNGGDLDYDALIEWLRGDA